MGTVALLHVTPGLADGLRSACAAAGLVVSAAHLHDLDAGHFDAEAFLRQHDPVVVVIDLAPPYPVALERLQVISRLPAAQGRQLVVTAPDPAFVAASLDHAGRLIEIVGQHEDLGPLILAIKEATRARPGR
ncbi:hypothetical protein TBR22_A41320 [Luteitalea sp. TBR-22]|uniref:hypothetical protein n=1 Tax=Luteitalea sp. TBR-22 TaxID=2802971 RepID=UPI001AF17885|nr:hypothetical protein [Luteitalea sp. TBR-22]BCS34906.1 hypothetical protein TBR22_A41320 [Luteitalea sp. TBR-22]